MQFETIEELLTALKEPTKHYHGGEVLNENRIQVIYEMNKYVKDFIGITSHHMTIEDYTLGYEEVIFYTRNHIWGYGVLSNKFVSCSYSLDRKSVPLNEIKDKVITLRNGEEKTVHMQGTTRYLFSVEEVADFLFNEYWAL